MNLLQVSVLFVSLLNCIASMLPYSDCGDCDLTIVITICFHLKTRNISCLNSQSSPGYNFSEIKYIYRFLEVLWL